MGNQWTTRDHIDALRQFASALERKTHDPIVLPQQQKESVAYSIQVVCKAASKYVNRVVNEGLDD